MVLIMGSQNHFRGLAPVKVNAGLDKGCVWSGHRAIGTGCGIGGEAPDCRMGRPWRVGSDLFRDGSRTKPELGMGCVLRLPQPEC